MGNRDAVNSSDTIFSLDSPSAPSTICTVQTLVSSDGANSLLTTPVVLNLFLLYLFCARNYRPCFRENQPKRSFSIKWKRAFWACFRENWVYKFGHCSFSISFVYTRSVNSTGSLRCEPSERKIALFSRVAGKISFRTGKELLTLAQSLMRASTFLLTKDIKICRK